jgi:hypothetical protein
MVFDYMPFLLYIRASLVHCILLKHNLPNVGGVILWETISHCRSKATGTMLARASNTSFLALTRTLQLLNIQIRKFHTMSWLLDMWKAKELLLPEPDFMTFSHIVSALWLLKYGCPAIPYTFQSRTEEVKKVLTSTGKEVILKRSEIFITVKI